MTGRDTESLSDPEATPKAKPPSLQPPNQGESEYAQALARFPCYSDAELPDTLRNCHVHQVMIPSLIYGFLIPGGTPYIARVAEELKIITLPPTNPSQPAAGPVMTLSDARMRLAGYIKRKWPKALFRDSSNWAYDLLWVDALDMDGAPSGTVLLLHFNDSPDKDRDMFHRSPSMFREVLKVTKTILRLPAEAEPRWFYHPASSRSSLFEFDLDRCFRHDYPPERNTSDSSA